MNSEQTVIEYIGDKESPVRADVLINGVPIHGVTRISFEHSADNIPKVVMDISGIEIEMNHQVKTLIESECAKVLIRRG